MTMNIEINSLKKLIDKQPEGSKIINVTPTVAEWVLSGLNIGNRP